MSIRYLTCNEPRNLETTNKMVLDILEYKRTASITCFVQKVSTVPFFQV